MARTTRRFRCAEAVNGCTEVGFYEFDTQRDAREYDLRYAKTPWRCTRHTRPDEVLTAGQSRRTTVLVATRLRDLKPLFWVPEGGTTGSGFSYGPGYKAYANDFPEGTRLVVTAALEPPAAPPDLGADS